MALLPSQDYMDSSNRPPHPVLDAQQDSAWYLAYTKPKAEEIGLDNLLKQGFEAWLPKIKAVKSRRRKAEDALFTQEAMFPRYLFFRPAHAQQSISVVRSTLGITSLVRFGYEFAQLPHDKLRQIAQWVEQQQQRSAAEIMGLQPGTAVKVVAGPLAGLDALVRMTAQDRVIVLLQLLGKDHEVSIPYMHLASA
ncbi:MAG: hypothetical protein RIS48_2471 [Pseudomonadota bacterium]